MSGYTNLRSLACSGNKLTALDVSYCPNLDSLLCDRNKLTFSTIITTPSISYLDCENQETMQFSCDDNSDVIDISSEYLDGTTTYVWYHDDTNKRINPSLYTESNGMFIFNGLDSGDSIYCVMLNSRFPGLTLVTSRFTLIGTDWRCFERMAQQV